MPLNSNRHAPLTSVAAPGSMSSAEFNSPYVDDAGSRSAAALQNGYPSSPTIQRPSSPYSPGMRSSSAQSQRQQPAEQNPFDQVTTGEIQLQNFQEGLPPPPPVSHSWKRIDRWAEDHYEELYDQLSEPATNNDVNELEHMLDCSLPIEVRESIQIHDGQERGGTPTGIIFGCMLLDCEEIVQEWQQWRKVNHDFLTESRRQQNNRSPVKAFGGSSSSSVPPQQGANPLWRQDLMSRQDSQPSHAVQKAYAHPGWIPLARDWGGNNLAVDVAPGPAGKWGQVIIFGRDYDCKYVVARSWAAFLAMVADDLNSEKWFVDEETSELKLKEFKTSTVEPGYLDILRWRMDQKYGRKGPKRKSMESNGAGRPLPNRSPSGSPTTAEPDRGRSGQRVGTTPVASSPLARVAEEGLAPLTLQTDLHPASRPSAVGRAEKLVEAPSPKVGSPSMRRGKDVDELMGRVGAENEKTDAKGLGVQGVDGIGSTKLGAGEGLKPVEL